MGVALAGRPPHSGTMRTKATSCQVLSALALSTRDASRSFSLALRATAQGKRRASPIDPEPNATAMLA